MLWNPTLKAEQNFKDVSLRWPRLAKSVMQRPGVRPSVGLPVCLSRRHTLRDSPGGSMRGPAYISARQ